VLVKHSGTDFLVAGLAPHRIASGEVGRDEKRREKKARR